MAIRNEQKLVMCVVALAYTILFAAIQSPIAAQPVGDAIRGHAIVSIQEARLRNDLIEIDLLIRSSEKHIARDVGNTLAARTTVTINARQFIELKTSEDKYVLYRSLYSAPDPGVHVTHNLPQPNFIGICNNQNIYLLTLRFEVAEPPIDSNNGSHFARLLPWDFDISEEHAIEFRIPFIRVAEDPVIVKQMVIRFH